MNSNDGTKNQNEIITTNEIEPKSLISTFPMIFGVFLFSYDINGVVTEI